MTNTKIRGVKVEDIFTDLEEFEDLDLDNEFVVKSHQIAEKLKKKGINIKKPRWKDLKAS